MLLTPDAVRILADADCPLCMARLGADAQVCSGCQTAFHAACLARGSDTHHCAAQPATPLRLAPWQVALVAFNVAIIAVELCVFGAIAMNSSHSRALRNVVLSLPASDRAIRHAPHPGEGGEGALDDRSLLDLSQQPSLSALLSQERWLCRDLADILGRSPLLLRADTMLVIQCGLDPSLGGSLQFGHSHTLGSMMALLALEEAGGGPGSPAPTAAHTALEALSQFLARDSQLLHHVLHEHHCPMGLLGEHPRLLHWMRGIDGARRAAIAATQVWADGMTLERTQLMVNRARRLGMGIYALRARAFGACPCGHRACDQTAGLPLPLLLWEPRMVLAIDHSALRRD